MFRVSTLATLLLLLLVTCGTPPTVRDVAGASATRVGDAVDDLGAAVAADDAADDPPAHAGTETPLPVDPPNPADLPVPLPVDPPAGLTPSPEPSEPEAPPSPDPPPPPERAVTETGWSPFATVGGVVLRHPSARVERVGFHESNHDGARQLEAMDTAVRPMTLETRERGTGSRSAADVVVDPQVEIRAPVTGTVLRAGTYVLYCDYRDDYAVIEPDAHPGWEVKILHIDGVRVRSGQHVHAGETVLAGGPTPLPFESQVDEHTAEPSWPHVHVEVVDPSIPDRPSPGGGC